MVCQFGVAGWGRGGGRLRVSGGVQPVRGAAVGPAGGGQRQRAAQTLGRTEIGAPFRRLLGGHQRRLLSRLPHHRRPLAKPRRPHRAQSGFRKIISCIF